MGHIIVSFATCRALPYFTHYLIKDSILWGGGGGDIEPKMCVLIFLTNLSETFPVIGRNERHRSRMIIGLHIKYP